ncbi:hypothetical protein [Bradyrhizobium sp. NP1]|uniref:hypothetical protein n=1 Tax=Bradyrhizobium sp. NP1 TaxID=3049772 RepID=UPI0025A52AF5|nr:hypothetical protein [Bradyrhizobium sp. NP1]WJR79994.1 hypothetical protein QOU61_09590 [Bradyrhizobium sp. NP1]
MTVRKTRRTATWLFLLACVGSVLPAPTSALPTDAPSLDAEVPPRADAPAGSSLWDTPAAPAPIVVRPPEPPPVAPSRTPSANPLWGIPLATLSATRERPIFSVSRRPPPPAVVAAPVVKPPPAPKPPRIERPQLALVGTIAGGDESFGIFVDQATKAALRLRIGEDYQGWKLRAVQGREVTLERDQQTTTLSLPQPGAGSVGAARASTDKAMAQDDDPSPRRARR